MPHGSEAGSRRGRSWAVMSAIALALALALTATAAPPASAAPDAAASSPGVEGAAAARAEDYWTPRRLRRAEANDPADLDEGSPTPVLDRSALAEPIAPLGGEGAITARTVDGDRAVGKKKMTDYPYRVHGKIFGTTPGGDYSCSGTVIGSSGKNVVFTAGHCVFDRGTAQFSTNVVFIPGYRKGKKPFGVYPASDLWALDGWRLLPDDSAAFSYDVAAIQLDRKVERQVGSRGIKFNVKRNRTFEIFGYPSRPSPPYDGERLIRCPKAEFVGRENDLPLEGGPVMHPSTIAGPCYMQQGSSGGGWVVGKGFVNSVVSHGYCDQVPDLCGFTLGPPFDAGAKNLYAAVGGGKRKPTDSVDCRKAKRRHAKAKRARRRAKQAYKRAKRKGSSKRGAKKRRYRQAKRRSRQTRRKLNVKGC
jgi:V8-like Glu-specific endopeptidase